MLTKAPNATNTSAALSNAHNIQDSFAIELATPLETRARQPQVYDPGRQASRTHLYLNPYSMRNRHDSADMVACARLASVDVDRPEAETPFWGC